MTSKRIAKRRLIASVASTALLLAALPGLAADEAATTTTGESNTYDSMFKRLDSDRDGHVSRQEAGKQPRFVAHFDAADANHDGRLAPDEFKKAHSAYDGERVASYAKDSLITAKVKAAMVKDSVVSALAVSVETAYGEVLLSGFVDNAQQARRAREIAARIDGVRQVHDNLVVKG